MKVNGKIILWIERYFGSMILLVALAGCSSTEKQELSHQNEFSLIFSGKATTIPFVQITRAFNHVYDGNLDVQDSVSGSGMDPEIRNAVYDDFQAVPGSYFGLHNSRSRTVLKFDTRNLSETIEVTVINEGVVTNTVVLKKGSLFDYQIFEY